METETNPNIALKPPPLNSDQLNYLIWRYLQEAGYGDAAVNLQRDWKVDPENLPFAKHIKGQALVSLVQRGLRYHHLSLTIDEKTRSLKQLSPSDFFFGPESGRPVSPGPAKESLYRLLEAQSGSPPTTSSIPKKRESDNYTSVDPAAVSSKRNRKVVSSAITSDRNGNGVRKISASTNDPIASTEGDYINGTGVSLRNMRSPSVGDDMNDESAMNGTGIDSHMDIDMKESTPGMAGTDSVSHEENDIPPPLIHTLTNGESVGIQVAPAKVANLGPSSTILSLPESSHVSRIAWQPADRSLLTAAGDHFCGVWRDAVASMSGANNTDMAYQDLLSFNDSMLISAVAWDSSGGLLAIATYADQTGQLHLFDGKELVLIENLPASQRAITSLKWLPSPLRLIGTAPYAEHDIVQSSSSTILLWDFTEMQLAASPLTLTVPELLVDVDSTQSGGEDVICTVGGEAVYYCRAKKELVIEHKWTLPDTEEIQWTFVKCSSYNTGEPTVVVASSESARLWLPLGNVIKPDAHEAPITGLEIRRRAFVSSGSNSSHDFATSSMDGTIKIWQSDSQNKSIELLHRLSIDRRYPIMSLAYSPDGFCLAGASFSNTRIWNAEHGYNLMASWDGTNEAWRGATLKDEDLQSAGGLSSVNGEGTTSNSDHSLAWDMDSKKLAFGLSSQVAIINFQR